MSRFAYGTLGIALLASGVALAKLPPPSPEEQAVAAAKKAKQSEQEQREKAALTKVQDQIARRYHKDHGTHPSADAGQQTSTVKLPKSVSDAPRQGGPTPQRPFSAEAHSAHSR
jgi:hypothetical protein